MKNREYNVLKDFMKSQTDYLSARSNRFIAMDIENPAIDYVALSKSFGLPARRVTRARDIAPAIEEGIVSGRANVVEVVVGTS